MVEVKIWVVVDSDGGYAVHAGGLDDACEAYENEVGGYNLRRAIEIALTVPDQEPVKLHGDVPALATSGAALQVTETPIATPPPPLDS